MSTKNWEIFGLIGTAIRLVEEVVIRRPHYAAPSQKEGPRINDEITAREVRVIDAEGENHGVITVEQGIRLAEEAGLDLVEVSPQVSPPVCKILDYGKYKYEQQKRRNEARKKQKTIEVKELKFRPNIEQHDYEVKMRALHKFIDEGDKVKVSLRFKGREMAHQELGLEVLQRVQQEMDEKAKVEQRPNMEGRQMIMVLAPR